MNLTLAWRNIWRNKVRSLLIMTSVALGLFAGVFVLALYEGMLKSRVRIVIDAEVAHLQLHHPQFKEDYDPSFILPSRDTLMVKLRSVPAVRYIAWRSVAQGMLSTPTGSAGVQILGVMASDENRVSGLGKKLVEGITLDSAKRNAVLIGRKLAVKMKLKLGSKIVLTFSDRDQNITAGAFRVVGIYQSNNTSLDELQVYVNHATLNEYLAIGNGGHEVAILLNDDRQVEPASREVKTLFPELDVKTWRESSPETDLMVTTVDQFSYIIIVIIMIALAFGIINTMLMAVLERTREIGMLTALGMNRPKVFRLILTETILLTLVGVPVGFLATLVTVDYYSKAGIDISSFSDAVMSGFGFSTMIYPEIPWRSIPTVMAIVGGTALVAALFPSLRAIKLQPADALRQ
ncbi:MAG: ABC transporter permease [Cyclobacteriaceae bacterium]|nr:ABC transporter permease [Cyclobacteriaceae bacterium]